MLAFPTPTEGHAAFLRGHSDAIAGKSRDAGPWRRRSSSFHERCLSAAYQRGYARGLQRVVQQRFGNTP
jgi:ribosome modulation factor